MAEFLKSEDCQHPFFLHWITDSYHYEIYHKDEKHDTQNTWEEPNKLSLLSGMTMKCSERVMCLIQSDGSQLQIFQEP